MKWEFQNVIPTARNGVITKYSTSLSAGKLAEMYIDGDIKYEGKVQRGSKINSKGEQVDIASIKKIKEIYQAMLTNNLHGGMITLNYLQEYETPLVYNQETELLEGTEPLLILDGQHRIKACVRWLEEYRKSQNQAMVLADPYEYEFPVVIENLSEEEMKKCFAEYALMPAKISKTRAEFLNVGSLSNIVIRYLMENSELKNKVECTTSNIRGTNPNIVTFSTLTQALNANFKVRTKEEAEMTSIYLTSFINSLVNTFPDEMGNAEPAIKNELRKRNLVTETLTWYGYMAVAQELTGKSEDEIKKVLKKLATKTKINKWQGMFLDRDNPVWKNRIFRDETKIVNNTSTQRFMAEAMVDYIVNDSKNIVKKIQENIAG